MPKTQIVYMYFFFSQTGIQLKNAQDEVNHLRSAMHELEATNHLLKD